jgi:spore coat protein SA
MKIALICTEKLPVPPIDGGAVQIYIDGILPYINQKHNITVYCVSHQLLMDEELLDGVRYIRLPAYPKEIYIENVINKIENDYDLVHVFNRPKWIKLLSEKLPDTKLSLSLHNEMFKPKKISSQEANECIDRVEFINTVSKFIANGVEQLYPKAHSKLRVVYSGVDIGKYKTNWSKEGLDNRVRIKKKYGLTNYRIVLFVGRINEKKGVDILLEAMRIVMATTPKVALVVIGSKWFGENQKTAYTEKLERIAEELKGPIVFTGFLPPDVVCEHYNIADVFVCPSQWNEPLARVHYEAMAAGIPIITTNRGGNAEVVVGYGNGIVISNYKDPIDISNNIKYLFRNPRLAKTMGITGRRLALKKYNWKRVAEEVFNGFEA